MKYISTRQDKTPYGLREAAFMGLAPDGGLFMPERIPQVDMGRVMELAAISYNEMSVYLAEQFFGGDMPARQLREVMERAYFFKPEMRAFSDRLFTLELFHGPTFAFKDFGARFMGSMFGALADRGSDLVILTATSGDTGSAVANGFLGVPGVKVVLLYPADRISPLQESQMTTLGQNIYPVRIDGSFDDCQRLVKELFNDRELRNRRNITSANSINILRWIPQSFYYFYGYYLWNKATGGAEPDIVVPSGNYGNISAGMLAWKMGMPVRRFIAASNANDVIPQFLTTGEYLPKESVQTAANAMDVGNPSNYERMMALYDDNFEKLTGAVCGFSAGDDRIMDAIREVKEKYGEFIDPHSSIGHMAAKAYDIDGFWLSTAHNAKFSEVIRHATGSDPALPPGLAKYLDLPRQFTPMAPDKEALTDFVEKL